MKKIYFFGLQLITLIAVCNNARAQTNLYIQGTATWNTATTNWGIISGGSGNLWSNNSVANFETSPVITLNGFNPFAYGVNCTSTGSLGIAASERLYLSSPAGPAIDVSSAQTLSMNNILAGGMGFSKTSAGTLMIGNNNNKFLNLATGITISGGIIDFADNATTAAGALRCMPVNLGGNTLQYSGLTASDMRIGGIGGSGTISLGALNSMNLYNFGTNSTAATITGTSMFERGTGSASQTFTGNTSGITGTYTFSGISLLDGAYGNTNSVTFSGAANNTLAGTTNNVVLRGATFILDNTTNNTSRLRTDNANGQVNITGGTLYFKGNASGTTFSWGGGTPTTKVTTFGGGQCNIIAELPSGASAATVVNFANNTAAVSLRDGTQMTINFVGNGGTLGTAGINPRILYTNAPIINSTNGLFSNTAAGITYGWAIVNGQDWATYDVTNGMKAATYTITGSTNTSIQAAANSSVIKFQPSANQTLTANVLASLATNGCVITLEPQGAGLSLDLATFTLETCGLLHRSSNSYTITGSTGSIFGGASATKYVYVMDPTAILSTSTNIATSANPLTKSGDGTFALTGASNLLNFTSAQNINICSGVLRTTSAAMGGNTATGGDRTTLRFVGGILELDGGFTLTRFGGTGVLGSGGGITFSGAASANGGFSAVNGASTVTITTVVGGSTAASLVWGTAPFVATGNALLFCSKNADSKITLSNNIALDDGTSTNNYFAREVYVYDNTLSATDEAELSGVISGGLNADLVKGGPGKLTLSNAANTFSGNAIVAQGTLIAGATGSLPAASSILVKNGATLQLSANNTITDLVLESGSTLALGTNTLTLTGNFTNNGGSITGTGTVIFNGTSQQYIDGVATSFYNLTLNNSNGMMMLVNTTVNNLLSLTSGTFTTSVYNLTIAGSVGRTSGNINASSGTATFANTVAINLPVATFTGNIKNLTMNGTGGVTLNDANTVTNNLTLTSGIITTTASNLLSLGASASTSGASNSSYVSGPVKKTGNTNFTFPVGKTGTGYVPIGVSAFTGTLNPVTDAFTAEYIRTSANSLGAVTAPVVNHVSNCDYWTLAKTSGAQTADITAYWNSNNPCGTGYITNLATLVLVHFNGASWNTSSWGLGSTSGTTAAGSITWPTVTTYSPFSLGSTSSANPLPISINYLNGTKQGGNHLLAWKVTCNSTPRATLSLERSTDARNFSSIYSITADALRCQQPFDHTDAQPLKGMNYYRLKITDADGKITYSNTIALLNAVQGFDIMNIAPNPVTGGTFKLNVASAQATKMNVVISDLQGRIVNTQTITLIGGYNSVDMNVANLAPGTYNMQGATADDRSRVIRFVRL